MASEIMAEREKDVFLEGAAAAGAIYAGTECPAGAGTCLPAGCEPLFGRSLCVSGDNVQATIAR